MIFISPFFLFNTTTLYTSTSIFFIGVSKIKIRYHLYNSTFRRQFRNLNFYNLNIHFFITQTLCEMTYNTFYLKPFPCISVSDKFLPPDFDFKILAVACPTFGFLVLELTAIPIYGLAIFNAG